MTNQIHNAILKSYMIKNKDKLKDISRPFFKGGVREESHVISEHRHVIERFLDIPKVTNLSEFSFLYQNLYLMTGGWKSFHYRGESRNYAKPKVSTFFREHDNPNHKIEIDEVRNFKDSEFGKTLEERFNSVGLSDDHYYWWFLTQHHSEKGRKIVGRNYQTRLLDITRNPYVALYFSCLENNNNDNDGVVYVFYNLAITPIELRPEGISKDDKRKLWRENPYSTYQDYIRDSQEQFDINRLITPDYERLPDLYEVTKRLIAQSGEFIVQSSIEAGGTFKFDIDGNSKSQIIKELNFIMQINPKTLLLE